jgi:hypothetical protein
VGDLEPSGEADDGRLVDADPEPSLSLDEALSVVGEPTRAAIVRALGDASADGDPTPATLSFSELQERVGVEDSGRFNYHLGELVGPFVRKTEEGYSLRLPGRRVYRAFVAGTLTDRDRVEPFPVGPCPNCDGEVTAAYAPEHLLAVECPTCETLYDAVQFPRRGLDGRSTADLLDAAYRRRHHRLGAMRRGVCHACGAPVDRRLARSAPGPTAAACGCDLPAYAMLSCSACDAGYVGHPANVALTTPAVVGLFAEHDRDPADARWWEDPVAEARASLAVREGDSMRAELTFAVGGDRLELVLNEDLQVIDSASQEE